MSNQEAPETAWFRARENEADEQLRELAEPMTSTVAGSTERDLELQDIDTTAEKQLEEIVAPAPSLAAGLARELGL